MPAAGSRQVTAAVVGIVIVAVLSAAAAVLSPPGSEGLPAGSSLSRDADGTAAAFLTLESLGYTVVRWTEPLSSIAGDPAAIVLVVADPAQAASNGDRRTIQTLVANGATVLVTGCLGASFLTDRAVAQPLADPEERKYSPRFRSPLTRQASEISMAAACGATDLGPSYLDLYADGKGPVVRLARIGKGLAVWWAGTTPIENRSIAAPGHLELFLAIIGSQGRTVLWDEFSHGQRRSLYSYAAGTPLPWLGVQALLIGLVAAAMYARRRAPILERNAESRASSLEFVDSMAGLYARAVMTSDAIRMAHARLRRLLLDVTRLPASTGDEALAAAGAAHVHATESELARALRAGAEAQPGTPVDAAKAVSLVRRLQTYAAALDR
jgi:hypothetical protein